MLHFFPPSTGNHQSNSEESRVARRMCVWIPNRLLPRLCCGLTCERLNIRRKSFFFSSSGVQSICSAEYGVVKGVVGVEDVEGEQAFFLPCTAGGETLRSFIILLLFLLFWARRSSRWVSVVRPHTCRKSTFFGERSIRQKGKKPSKNLIPVMNAYVTVCVFAPLKTCPAWVGAVLSLFSDELSPPPHRSHHMTHPGHSNNLVKAEHY